MRHDQNWHWASGAAVATVAAGTGLSAHLTLRASSDASFGRPALLLGTVVLALVLWPLAARATSVATLTGVLAAAQFGTHALTVLAAGQAAGPRSLVCCPSSTQVRPGIVGQLTADAGWALAAAQLVACLLLAVVVRGGRAAADFLASVVGFVRALFSMVVVALIVLRPVPVPAGRRVPRPTPARVLDAGRVLARRIVRRGPPTTALSPVRSRAAVAPLALPAAG